MTDDDSSAADGSEPTGPVSPRTPCGERTVARARREPSCCRPGPGGGGGVSATALRLDGAGRAGAVRVEPVRPGFRGHGGLRLTRLRRGGRQGGRTACPQHIRRHGPAVRRHVRSAHSHTELPFRLSAWTGIPKQTVGQWLADEPGASITGVDATSRTMYIRVRTPEVYRRCSPWSTGSGGGFRMAFPPWWTGHVVGASTSGWSGSERRTGSVQPRPTPRIVRSRVPDTRGSVLRRAGVTADGH